MNIGYLHDFQWYPPQGGATVHAYQVAQHLINRGHVIHTLHFHDQAPEVKIYRQRQAMEFVKNIDVLYVRIQGSIGIERWTLLKLLRLSSLPVLWEVNAPLEELLTKGRTPQQVNFLNTQRKLLAKLVDAAICVSSPLGEYAQKNLNIKKTYVIANGSDPELFSPVKRSDNVYADLGNKYKVVWSGSSYYSWQGLDLTIEIAKKMRSIDQNIVFILITEREGLSSYEPLPENIVVIDRKKYLEIPAFLASADLGLCLYHQYGWDGKFYFSPLKLFDYMACGLPVIATDFGQISEVIKHNINGLLTDNTFEQIIQQILLLKNNPSESKRLGSEARNTIINDYNWKNVGEKTEEILQDLRQGKSS